MNNFSDSKVRKMEEYMMFDHEPLIFSQSSDIHHSFEKYTTTSTVNSTISPQILNFSSNEVQHEDHLPVSTTTSRTVNRTPSQAHDHVMAERKRRQKLGQLFINLSKVVPGLKKLDKASLLDDAIDYVKALEERVSALEEEDKVLMMKKRSSTPAPAPTTSTSTDEKYSEIKVRVMKKNVLIKIWCKKQKGIMSRIPCEMEKMNLSVKDMRVMPFGGDDAFQDITILAQMNNEFNCTMKDIVKHLEMAFLHPV